MAQKAEQSTIEEIRKKQTVKREIQEYIIKDKTTEETVKVKYNYLSILVMYYLQTISLIKRVYKDIL